MARTGNNSRIPQLGVYPQTSAPTFGTDLTDLSSSVAEVIGETFANVSDLPGSGNWTGRTVWVSATNGMYVWRGNSWVPTSPQYAIRQFAGNRTQAGLFDADPGGASVVTDASLLSVSSNAIAVNRSGAYMVDASVNWSTSSVGLRSMEITSNGASMARPLGGGPAKAEGPVIMSASGIRTFVAGDTLRMRLEQTSTATLAYAGQLSLTWLRP